MASNLGETVICTTCGQPLTFANVIYFLEDTVVAICPCRPNWKLTVGTEHPRNAELRKELLGETWANIVIPYTAAEYPPFALPGIVQHEQNVMKLRLLRVFTPYEFERACKEERRVPDSGESDDGSL